MEIRQLIQGIANRCGIELRRYYPPESRRAYPADFDDGTVDVILQVRQHTMSSPERLSALCHAVKYLATHEIPGAFVECGVWRGGSMKAVALTLMQVGRTDRDLYLFDTFEGLPPPNERDGCDAAEYFARATRKQDALSLCICGLDHVRETMLATGYPEHQIHFIQGRVEQTIPDNAPEKIAFLRLDTDWYESTRHELEHLFPRLVVGGVLIIDDYGHWKGARLAVDEYLAERRIPLLLNRIDYSGRIAVVTGG